MTPKGTKPDATHQNPLSVCFQHYPDIGTGWTGRDGTGRDWTGLDGTGLDGTGLDGTGRDWTGRDKANLAHATPFKLIFNSFSKVYFAHQSFFLFSIPF